jgi:hypothetical protein
MCCKQMNVWHVFQIFSSIFVILHDIVTMHLFLVTSFLQNFDVTLDTHGVDNFLKRQKKNEEVTTQKHRCFFYKQYWKNCNGLYYSLLS